jgi:hypothetical protein
VAEVARQRDDDEPRVAARRRLEQLERVIGAAVVHEDDLVRAARDRIEHGAEASQQLGDARRLVVERDRDGEPEARAHRRARPLK